MYNNVLKRHVWLLGFTLAAPLLAMAISKLAGEFMWLPAWNGGLTLSVLVLLLTSPVAGLVFLNNTPPSSLKKLGWPAWLLLIYAPSLLFSLDMQTTPCFRPATVIIYPGPGGNFYVFNAGISPSGLLSCHHSYNYSEIRRKIGFGPLADNLVHVCQCRFDKPRQVGKNIIVAVDRNSTLDPNIHDMQVDLRTGQLSALLSSQSE